MYIGNDLQIAHPSYKIIDDISSGFNGSTTSFALQVSGATPVPFPISTQQVMISVNGVVQEPDPTGSAGFKLLGSNIVFSSAPANGHAFFGVINAGADYVTAGSEFPDGSATAPSFTFQDDQDTGWFRSGSGAVGFSANGVNTIGFDGNGLTVTGDASFVGDSAKNLLWDKSDGQLEFADNAKATFGTGNDLEIFHNGYNSKIADVGTGALILSGSVVKIENGASSETQAVFTENGAVELYFDDSKKFETSSTGGILRGTMWTAVDNTKIAFGTNDDLQIVHDGTDSYIGHTLGSGILRIDAAAGSEIRLTKSGPETLAKFIPDGAVQLYYDNAKKIETASNGINVTGKVDLSGALYIADNQKAYFGAGPDLEIYHNGTHSYILNNHATGQFILGGDQVLIKDGSNSEVGLKYVKDGAVELYHNDSKKLETTSTGITITGSVVDTKGDLRTIPQNYKTSAYTLSGSDAGKHIYYSGSAAAITVPSGQFNTGDAVTIISANSSTDITIVQSGTTIYFANDGSTGTRTLASKGIATLICVSSNVFAISGAGLS